MTSTETPFQDPESGFQKSAVAPVSIETFSSSQNSDSDAATPKQQSTGFDVTWDDDDEESESEFPGGLALHAHRLHGSSDYNDHDGTAGAADLESLLDTELSDYLLEAIQTHFVEDPKKSILIEASFGWSSLFGSKSRSTTPAPGATSKKSVALALFSYPADAFSSATASGRLPLSRPQSRANKTSIAAVEYADSEDGGVGGVVVADVSVVEVVEFEPYDAVYARVSAALVADGLGVVSAEDDNSFVSARVVFVIATTTTRTTTENTTSSTLFEPITEEEEEEGQVKEKEKDRKARNDEVAKFANDIAASLAAAVAAASVHEEHAARVSTQINELEVSVEDVSLTGREVARGIAGIVAERDLLKHEREGLVAEKEGLVAENERLVAEKEQLIAENERLVGEKEGFVAEKERLVTEREELVAENERLAAEKERLVAEKESLAGEKEQLALQIRELETGLVAANERAAVAEERGESEAGAYRAAVALHEAKEGEFARRKNALEEQVRRLEREVAEVVGQRADVLLDLADADEELKAADQRISELEAVVASMKGHVGQLVEQSSRAATARVAVLEEQVARLEKTITTLRTESQFLKALLNK
ncbi:hypothetical protein HK100_000434 [Physocladia obscura]|uniref:FAZ1 C-terminal region domain-containing protein n=1 Tax=Physocladia obscura TaxID=109957 RepID=A0AAD5XF79_9FUNG|nr:hypothetical protein HK100_000434 [Physocladia obscura]